jgi:hypothetical protein
LFEMVFHSRSLIKLALGSVAGGRLARRPFDPTLICFYYRRAPAEKARKKDGVSPTTPTGRHVCVAVITVRSVTCRTTLNVPLRRGANLAWKGMPTQDETAEPGRVGDADACPVPGPGAAQISHETCSASDVKTRDTQDFFYPLLRNDLPSEPDAEDPLFSSKTCNIAPIVEARLFSRRPQTRPNGKDRR